MKVGIVGYGNLGRGVLIAVDNAVDMDLVGIFTRREPSSLKPCLHYPVYSVNELVKFKDEIDEWIIDTLKEVGCVTAKNVLAIPRDELIKKTDLEEETIDNVISVLKAEFED